MKTVLTGWFRGLEIPRFRGRLEVDKRVKSLTYALVKAERERDKWITEATTAWRQLKLAREREAELESIIERMRQFEDEDARVHVHPDDLFRLERLLKEELELARFQSPVAMEKSPLIELLLAMLEEIEIKGR